MGEGYFGLPVCLMNSTQESTLVYTQNGKLFYMDWQPCNSEKVLTEWVTKKDLNTSR